MARSRTLLQAGSGTYRLADGRRRLCKGASTSRHGIRLWTRALPGRMDAMNVKIDDLTFDRGHYDADADVLYLGRGATRYASDTALTPEGHGVRYDGSGEVIGVTIINARRIIESDGYLTITLPHSVRVEAGEIAAALG
jgi:uncharacterized protein YuzE